VDEGGDEGHRWALASALNLPLAFRAEMCEACPTMIRAIRGYNIWGVLPNSRRGLFPILFITFLSFMVEFVVFLLSYTHSSILILRANSIEETNVTNVYVEQRRGHTRRIV